MKHLVFTLLALLFYAFIGCADKGPPDVCDCWANNLKSDTGSHQFLVDPTSVKYDPELDSLCSDETTMLSEAESEIRWQAGLECEVMTETFREHLRNTKK